MPPRNRPRHRHRASPEASAFDALAKRAASRTIPRGRAIKLAGAALVAPLVGGSVALEEAAATTDQVCKDRLALSNKRCAPVGPTAGCSPTNSDCYCIKTINDDIRCVNLAGFVCPIVDQCDRNADCGTGQVCVQIGGCCCPEGTPQRRRCKRRNLCAPLCTD